MDIIRVPFGYLLDWLCQFTGSYGISLILFSLIIKLVLMPLNAKSKKSMLKMSRLSPRLKALEIACGDNKEKYQQEAAKLYKEEGVGVFGGCLWSFVPLLILIPLYQVIREPITYIMHIASEDAAQIVEIIKSQVELGGNQYYHQMEAASYISQYREAILESMPHLADKLRDINFTFLGLDMSRIPSWKVWTFAASWADWGMFIIPILSAGSQLLTMLVSQKMNGKVATNEKGEQDQAAAQAANSTNRTMMLVMPVMSLYFCFVMPAAISIYWIAQAVFSTAQDYVLTKHYRKVYEAEDMVKREEAALRAAKEAERERLRAERREKYGEERILDPNTSKKKLKQQEEAAKKAAADAYAAAMNPVQEEEEGTPEDKHFSGDPERPYCRGRGYKPNRYGRKVDEE